MSNFIKACCICHRLLDDEGQGIEGSDWRKMDPKLFIFSHGYCKECCHDILDGKKIKEQKEAG